MLDPNNSTRCARLIAGEQTMNRLGSRTRRHCLFALASAFSAATIGLPTLTRAQSIPRIGFIRHGSRDAFSEGFRQGMRDLGYVEGKNIVIEYRWTEGNIERIGPFIDEMMRLKVRVIVGAGDPVLEALHKTTKTIPVVMTNSQTPVEKGFAASLARPGGNMTGLTSIGTELAGKRVELLRDAFRNIRQIAVLSHTTSVPEQVRLALAAAKTLNISAQSIEVRKTDELQAAFATAQQARADALVITGSSAFFAERTQIALLAAMTRLPTIYPHSGFVDAGGLMSYGANFTDMFRRAAVYVDKILKGAKPGDLPIEQPTKFELVLNVKTAKLLGITFPPEIMVRADRVIQ
jgi:putative ABC transport system substrate-binding protein